MNTTRKRRRRQKDTGSVRERCPGKWQLRYKTHQKQVFAESREEAYQQLQAFVDRIRGGDVPSKLTFGELADDYMKAIARECEATTVALRKRNLDQHVRPAIGAVALDDLRRPHIRRLLDDARDCSRRKTRRGQPLGPKTLENILTLVRGILAWGVDEEYISKNVAHKVEAPASAFVERPVLTVDDVKALLAAAKSTELDVIVPTAIGTGLRRGELCALRWGDLDLDLAAGTIAVRRAAALLDGKVIVKAPKTKKSQRSDHLPAFVRDLLVRHKAEQLAHLVDLTSELEARRRQRDGYVFLRRSGEPWNPNELSRQFSRLVRRKKLPLFRFHDLRHGFASLAFAAGVPMKTVSESLGHSSIGITAELYTHLLDEQKREKAAVLDAYLDRAVRPAREAETAS